MADEPSISIRIDDRLDAYREFFDALWAEEIDALAAGTKLAEPVFLLSVNWRAAANTCAMPWLVIRSLRQQWAGFREQQAPFAARITKALAGRISDAMADSLSHSKRKRLAEAVERIGSEVQQQVDDAPGARHDVPTLWKALLEDAEFQLALWGSQRIGYGSIYHSYENFVRHCIALALNRPDYRGQKIHALVRDAEQCFGKSVAEYCLADRQVRIARVVRNALAHGGGRETEQLKAVPHHLIIEDSKVQILASDTRELFDLLKRRALRLVERAATLPAMR